jgi:hypothetical protein
MAEHSEIVSEGMKRVCSAITTILRPIDFKRGNGRKWVRQRDGFVETIWLSRSGATYGAPYSPSISLLIDLSSVRSSDGRRADLGRHETMLIRRPTGYCYHHRFNAQTHSTYDRCIEELGLFMNEVAEPWFKAQRRSN